jgi:signal transduction histidine kinase
MCHEDRGAGRRGVPLRRSARPRRRAVAERSAPAFQSFGLGLWIVKNLVESLGSALHVATEAGMGTAMGFVVPSLREPTA